MARLPEISFERLVSSTPRSSVSAGERAAPYRQLVEGLDATAGTLEDVAVDLAAGEGANAVYRDEEGNLQVQQRFPFGRTAAAYNRAAQTAFGVNVEGDIQRRAFEMRQEAQRDPEAFQTSWKEYADRLTQEVPREMRGAVRTMLDREGAATLQGIVVDNHRRDIQTFEADINARAGAIAREAEALAHNHGLDSPEVQEKFDEYDALLGELAGNPEFTYSEDQRAIDMTQLASRSMAEALIGDAERAVEAGDFETVSRMTDALLNDPSFDLEQDERRRLARLVEERMVRRGEEILSARIDSGEITSGAAPVGRPSPAAAIEPAVASDGAAARAGDGYFARLRSAESGGNDEAKNPLSSASGRYQFTRATWEGLGYDWEDRFDPQLQEEAVRRFTAQNAAAFESHFGRQPSDAELYAMHFFGRSGGVSVMSQDPSTPMEAVFPPRADGSEHPVIAANGSVLRGKTVGELMASFERRFGSGQGAAQTEGARGDGAGPAVAAVRPDAPGIEALRADPIYQALPLNARNRMDARLRARSTSAAPPLIAAGRDMIRLLDNGGSVSDAEVGSMVAALEATGDDTAARVARDLSTEQDVASFKAQYRLLPLEGMQTTAQDLDTQVEAMRAAGETTPPSLIAMQRASHEILDQATTAIENNPIGWANRVGLIAVEPFDVVAAGEKSLGEWLSLRQEQAEAVGRYYGQEVPPLTDIDVRGLQETWRTADTAQRLAMVDLFAEYPDVLEQVHDGSPDMAHLAGLRRGQVAEGTLLDALAGMEIIANDDNVPSSVPSQVAPMAFEGLNVAMGDAREAMGATMDTAWHIYVARRIRQNKPPAIDTTNPLDEALFREALREATGGRQNVEGEWEGGLSQIGGDHYVILPDGVTHDEFMDATNRLFPSADLRIIPVPGSIGSPRPPEVSLSELPGGPGYVQGLDGLVPATPETMRRFSMVSVGDGLYAFYEDPVLREGPMVTADGREIYTVRWEDLERAARASEMNLRPSPRPTPQISPSPETQAAVQPSPSTLRPSPRRPPPEMPQLQAVDPLSSETAAPREPANPPRTLSGREIVPEPGFIPDAQSLREPANPPRAEQPQEEPARPQGVATSPQSAPVVESRFESVSPSRPPAVAFAGDRQIIIRAPRGADGQIGDQRFAPSDIAEFPLFVIPSRSAMARAMSDPDVRLPAGFYWDGEGTWFVAEDGSVPSTTMMTSSVDMALGRELEDATIDGRDPSEGRSMAAVPGLTPEDLPGMRAAPNALVINIAGAR